MERDEALFVAERLGHLLSQVGPHPVGQHVAQQCQALIDLRDVGAQIGVFVGGEDGAGGAFLGEALDVGHCRYGLHDAFDGGGDVAFDLAGRGAGPGSADADFGQFDLGHPLQRHLEGGPGTGGEERYGPGQYGDRTPELYLKPIGSMRETTLHETPESL